LHLYREVADADKDAPDFARTFYSKVVPMGSDLTGGVVKPTFLIEAMRDPDGAKLDRIQIVKGWIDSAGKLQEQVLGVAWSGNRKPGKGSKLPAAGSTVKGATYTNSIGAPVLSAFWRDPSYRSGERAFYYARVLEIPTPTWFAYDMVQIGQRALPKDARLVHQERGYGSPIWVGPR
jgi:hypothetical protein